MSYSGTTPEQRANVINWCKEHEWCLNARFEGDSLKVVSGNQGPLLAEFSFDSHKALREWAGY